MRLCSPRRVTGGGQPSLVRQRAERVEKDNRALEQERNGIDQRIEVQEEIYWIEAPFAPRQVRVSGMTGPRLNELRPTTAFWKPGLRLATP